MEEQEFASSDKTVPVQASQRTSREECNQGFQGGSGESLNP